MRPAAAQPAQRVRGVQCCWPCWRCAWCGLHQSLARVARWQEASMAEVRSRAARQQLSLFAIETYCLLSGQRKRKPSDGRMRVHRAGRGHKSAGEIEDRQHALHSPTQPGPGVTGLPQLPRGSTRSAQVVHTVSTRRVVARRATLSHASSTQSPACEALRGHAA